MFIIPFAREIRLVDTNPTRAPVLELYSCTLFTLAKDVQRLHLSRIVTAKGADLERPLRITPPR
jgi:hypothetical protein